MATHSEDKLMGSDIILPALLPPPHDPMTQVHSLRPHVVIIWEAVWIWIIFLHTQTPHIQPRTSQQQAKDLFYNTF